jgi:hypothetical protein
MKMKKHEIYVYEGQDLTFDDVNTDEVTDEVPEALHPTREMQARFLRNCERLGILIRVPLH